MRTFKDLEMEIFLRDDASKIMLNEDCEGD